MNSSKQDGIAETLLIYMYIHTYVCMYIYIYFYIIYNIYISVYVDTLMYKCVFIYIYIKSKSCVFPAIVNTIILHTIDDRAPASLFQMKNISSYF